ncbi:uncharacterized protein FIBRA_02288 [Fibroporia radiculosa]|uniref:Peptidase M50B-like-domain-containing protein n=1 Tax=Fibroporia radiculosa TaxID=599839 RepID=J4G1J2_9APHY|nr:uncharacterized protein FIBRA_02288 [Fibroporia radiculosa]CCM00258.1 predicted protein [Fibroporia radiculosa]
MAPITPTSEQVPVLYVIVVYTVVIFALWVIPGVRLLINPLKLFTIGLHEFCHIVAAVFTGGKVEQVTIDPDRGGATEVKGGKPLCILVAGYFGSTIFGGIFVLAGFDILMAKIVSFFLGLGLIAPLVLVRNKLTILLTIIYEGILVGFWFIDHGQALRWYCLLVGVMNVFYVVWDIADDKYFRKANDSDASQFAMLYPRVEAHCEWYLLCANFFTAQLKYGKATDKNRIAYAVWAALWILFEIGVLIGFVFIGIVAFRLTDQEMYEQAAQFLPT